MIIVVAESNQIKTKHFKFKGNKERSYNWDFINSFDQKGKK